jgi:hypothetical protein
LTFGRNKINGSQRYERIPYNTVRYDPDPDNVPEDERPQQDDDEDKDTFWERTAEWEKFICRIILPELDEFELPNISEPENVVNLKRDYTTTGLQIIVKLANIHLTVEKPDYEGGTWHVEG